MTKPIYKTALYDWVKRIRSEPDKAKTKLALQRLEQMESFKRIKNLFPIYKRNFRLTDTAKGWIWFRLSMLIFTINQGYEERDENRPQMARVLEFNQEIVYLGSGSSSTSYQSSASAMNSEAAKVMFTYWFYRPRFPGPSGFYGRISFFVAEHLKSSFRGSK